MHELQNVINVYSYETGDRAPVIEKIQTISTTATRNPGNLTAACAMRLSPDEKYVYCTNAGAVSYTHLQCTLRLHSLVFTALPRTG